MLPLAATVGLVVAGCTSTTPGTEASSAASASTATSSPTAARPSATVGPPPPAPGPATGMAEPSIDASASPRASVHYAFPVAGCPSSYGRSHYAYPATDIFVHQGCRFVAPTSGRVDEVSRVDRWTKSTNRGADRGGISVSIVGDDGVRYYGSHLSAIAAGVTPGTRVRAGQLLALTGQTGDARLSVPHLHFGISWPTAPGMWWVRRGEVWPQPYLGSWRTGGQRSPVAAVAVAEREAGPQPTCRTYC